ncbi:MAG: 2TM domain-containing protein [Cyanophyceae cyanobacterium]
MSAPEVHLYTQEEVQQILHLAITRQASDGEFDRQQLSEIAQELGIDEACLQAAEQDWLMQQSIGKQRREFDSYRRSQLKQKVVRYAIVNIFLISLNVVSAGAVTWSLYVLLFWGLKLSLNAWKTFQSQGEAYEQAFQRWQLRLELRRSLSTLWGRLQKAWQV